MPHPPEKGRGRFGKAAKEAQPEAARAKFRTEVQKSFCAREKARSEIRRETGKARKARAFRNAFREETSPPSGQAESVISRTPASYSFPYELNEVEEWKTQPTASR